MSIDNVFVLIFSGIGIIFTYWFFLMRSEKEVVVLSDSIDVIVEGGYQPEVISIPVGKTTKLNFTRKDPNSCLEEVILSDFKVRKTLPLNQIVTISITPQKIGEYIYSCGMNMFHGRIIVK